MSDINLVVSGDVITSVRANQVKSYIDLVENPMIENKTGVDLSGISGAKNRVLSLAATPERLGLVFCGGQNLTPVTDFSISGANITFLNNVTNSMSINVLYFSLL